MNCDHSSVLVGETNTKQVDALCAPILGIHMNPEELIFSFLGEIAALVDTLVAKTRAWEEDHGISFTYDGVPLLAMLDEYAMLRHEREEEKRRLRVSFQGQQRAVGLAYFTLILSLLITLFALYRTRRSITSSKTQNRKPSLVQDPAQPGQFLLATRR